MNKIFIMVLLFAGHLFAKDNSYYIRTDAFYVTQITRENNQNNTISSDDIVREEKLRNSALSFRLDYGGEGKVYSNSWLRCDMGVALSYINLNVPDNSIKKYGKLNLIGYNLHFGMSFLEHLALAIDFPLPVPGGSINYVSFEGGAKGWYPVVARAGFRFEHFQIYASLYTFNTARFGTDEVDHITAQGLSLFYNF